MVINQPMISLLILLLLFARNSRSQVASPYTTICPSTHYLSSTELTCTPCSPNAMQSSNGLSCICKPGYIYTRGGIGSSVECQQCQNNMVPSPDGWSCIQCDKSPSATTCSSCPVDRMLNWNTLQNNQNFFNCTPCAQRYSSSNNLCQLCLNRLNTRATIDCVCPSSMFRSDTACLLRDLASYRNVSSLTYAGVSIDSGYIKTNMMDSVALCEQSIDSGCQSLANMCVIDLYKIADYEAGFGPCGMYGQLDFNRGPRYTKKINFPWLYYSQSPIRPITLDKQYSRGDLIQIVLAAYDISGQFLGFRNASQDYSLQLCSNSAISRAESFRFGTYYTEKCSIPIAQLLNQSLYQPIFFDPYISYTDQNRIPQLYPIQVQIRDSDSSPILYTRRILLVDNVGSVSYPFQTNQTGSYVRYARSIRLVVTKAASTTFDINSDGKIDQPYIEINMTTSSSSMASSYANISFEVVYYNSNDYTSGFRYSVSVAMGVLCALAGLYAILRSFFWCRRSGISGFEGLVLLKLLAYACASISNVFFLVIFGVSLYFLILYKNQRLFTIIPPDDDSFFVAYLISAFLLKLLEIIHIFVTQCTIDVFLIDWERPKHVFAPKPVIERSKFDHTDNNGDQAALTKDRIQHNSGVSIWRSYFIANEWNEIQTYRKTSLTFNLVIVLLFMEVIGFGNITRFDPFVVYNPARDAYAAPYYRMFRFAVIVAIFAITAFIQWLYTILIYERLVEDKLRNYVDLCSVSNVSVFVLAHRQYGYYIHGRSVHGTADVSLAEMYVALQKENSGSCAKRGLENDSMQQTYIMALPNNFRDGLDAVYRPSGTRVADESRTLQYLEVNKFLDRFINRTNIPRITFRFQDRKFFEDVFDGEFEDNSFEGRFYRDNGTSFGNVLFYGQELSLITFDILLFCVADLILQNTVFDAFITWGLVTILKLIRNGCGAHNLANKTLVDRRFLI